MAVLWHKAYICQDIPWQWPYLITWYKGYHVQYLTTIHGRLHNVLLWNLQLSFSEICSKLILSYDLENIQASHLPRISIAYTGLVAASESRLRHHNATPAPKPCRRTIGVLVDSWFKEMVQTLSAVPTTGPMSTYHPRYPDFKPTKRKSLQCTILCNRKYKISGTSRGVRINYTFLNTIRGLIWCNGSEDWLWKILNTRNLRLNLWRGYCWNWMLNETWVKHESQEQCMGILQCCLYSINRYLWKILKIFWYDITSNEEMWRCAQEKSVAIQVKLQKW